MANRNQNFQSGEQGRRDYRSSEDQGSGQFGGARDRDESEGRSSGYSGYGDFGQGDYNNPGRSANTGQSRYGQGSSSSYGQPNYGGGTPRYGEEYGSSGTSDYGRSSFGRGGYSGAGSYGSQGWQEPYGEGQQYGSAQGMHRGKGPKNFQRSDERIKELLCERLHDDPHIDASEITVTVQGGRITLEGTVDSRRTKNAVEDVAEQCGVQDVQNNLRVQRFGERGMEGTSGSSANRSTAPGRSTMENEESDQSKQKRN
jgi:osmotically-inducible protein OsmY